MRQPICCAQPALKYMTTIMVLLVPLAHGTAPATPNSKADQRSSLCSRPGYVFIPCKQPANGDQKVTLLPTSHTASANGSLQSICDQTRTCAAYTTGGMYYTVSAKTGTIGPLINMSNCQPYQNITRAQDCQGIYVSDGHMAWRPLLTVTRKLSPVGKTQPAGHSPAPTSSWRRGLFPGFSFPPPPPPPPPPGGGFSWPFGTTANSAATAANNSYANGGVFAANNAYANGGVFANSTGNAQSYGQGSTTANSAATAVNNGVANGPIVTNSGAVATSVPDTLQGGYTGAVASGGGSPPRGQEPCTLC